MPVPGTDTRLLVTAGMTVSFVATSRFAATTPSRSSGSTSTKA